MEFQDNITWERSVEQKFREMMERVPVFMRPIAERKVSEKAESLVRQDKRKEVTEKDMVDAFFAATPGGFHGPMKADMEDLGIDYTKYGYAQKFDWGDLAQNK